MLRIKIRNGKFITYQFLFLISKTFLCVTIVVKMDGYNNPRIIKSMMTSNFTDSRDFSFLLKFTIRTSKLQQQQSREKSLEIYLFLF